MKDKEKWQNFWVCLLIFYIGFQIYELVTTGSCTIASPNTDYVGKVYLEDLPGIFIFIAVIIGIILIIAFIDWIRNTGNKKK